MAKGGNRPLPFDERLDNVLCSFWKQVSKGGPDDCWAWIGPTLRTNRPWQRYGYINVWRGVLTGGGSKNYRAHRFAWMLMNGPIPVGLNVLHRCDNSNCVNPSHLFLGTQKENVEDQRAKGRLWYGSKNGRAKLTEEQALYCFQSDERPSDLGRRFGVHPSQISKIRNGTKWKHLHDRKLCRESGDRT